LSEAELSEEEMTQELALALRSSGYRRGAVSTRFEYKHMGLIGKELMGCVTDTKEESGPIIKRSVGPAKSLATPNNHRRSQIILQKLLKMLQAVVEIVGYDGDCYFFYF
jgi:hypothetical protein